MHQSVTKTLFDLTGWAGALLFLTAYFLLIIRRWAATSVLFHLFNISGGLFLGASAMYDSSYPAAFINFAWALIAMYGLYNDHLKAGHPVKRPGSVKNR